jgi:hypothetical protein
MLTIKQTVRNGVDLLNISVPGWVNRIDLDTLDVQSCDQCIVGQIFSVPYEPFAFDNAILQLELDYERNEYGNYGFSCPAELCDTIRQNDDEKKQSELFAAFFGELTAEWKRVILEIQNGEDQDNQSTGKESVVSDQQIESESSALV